jgi:hypothetical protein
METELGWMIKRKEKPEPAPKSVKPVPLAKIAPTKRPPPKPKTELTAIRHEGRMVSFD